MTIRAMKSLNWQSVIIQVVHFYNPNEALKDNIICNSDFFPQEKHFIMKWNSSDSMAPTNQHFYEF